LSAKLTGFQNYNNYGNIFFNAFKKMQLIQRKFFKRTSQKLEGILFFPYYSKEHSIFDISTEVYKKFLSDKAMGLCVELNADRIRPIREQLVGNAARIEGRDRQLAASMGPCAAGYLRVVDWLGCKGNESRRNLFFSIK
jgi:hypothetical protein